MSDETSLTLTLTLADRDEAVHLFGHHDLNLRLIKDAFPEVKIIARGDTIQISGPTGMVERVEHVFTQLRQTLQQQGTLTAENVRTAVALDEPAERTRRTAAALAGHRRQPACSAAHRGSGEIRRGDARERRGFRHRARWYGQNLFEPSPSP